MYTQKLYETKQYSRSYNRHKDSVVQKYEYSTIWILKMKWISKLSIMGKKNVQIFYWGVWCDPSSAVFWDIL